MSQTELTTPAGTGEGSPDPRRWQALIVLALVQFIIFLDATIVNVALPSIQKDLGFTASGLTWVVNGYLLAAGGLLLVGGRLSDLLGRRRIFSIGTALFIVASLTAALAQNQEVLIASRFGQGIAEALAAPAAMSLVALLFTDPVERAKAFGIWGGLAGLGSALGVVLSGVLTDLASWRWIFYINLPIALIPLLLAPKLISESKAAGGKRPAYFSALLVTTGLVAVIAGLLAVPTSGWGSADALLPLIGGIVALGAFIGIQAKSSNPLVPLRFFANRTRVTGNAAVIFLSSSTAAMFFLTVLYMQEVLHYSPLQSGLAWLPFCVVMMVGLMVSMKLMPKLGIRNTMVVGLTISALGLLTLSTIPVDGSYFVNLLPAMVLISIGAGVTGPALQGAALHDVSMEDAGLGSGVLTTVQQMGQALGLTVIVTIALSVTTAALSTGSAAVPAAVDGYQTAFVVGAIVLALGALASFLLMERNKQTEEVAEAQLAEQPA